MTLIDLLLAAPPDQPGLTPAFLLAWARRHGVGALEAADQPTANPGREEPEIPRRLGTLKDALLELEDDINVSERTARYHLQRWCGAEGAPVHVERSGSSERSPYLINLDDFTRWARLKSTHSRPKAQSKVPKKKKEESNATEPVADPKAGEGEGTEEPDLPDDFDDRVAQRIGA